LYVDEWEGFMDGKSVGETAEKSIRNYGKRQENKDNNFKV
jgi:hypothetical protein